MYVALVGGSGRTGSRILRELTDRGHRARLIGRSVPEGVEDFAVDELADAAKTAEAVRGVDAVISAYAPPATDTHALVGVFWVLVEAVKRSGVPRLLVVGGAGLLEVAPGVTLLTSGMLPEEWRGIALSHQKALGELQRSAVNWTYLSPAGYFEPGERRGHYRTGGTNLVVDAAGESRISMEDYAIAMVDELENAKYPRAVCSVGW